MCASKDCVLLCMEQPLSLIYALYFQKCNNHIASSKSETWKLPKKLRSATRAGEQNTFVRSKKRDYFHGYQQLLIAIIGFYSGRGC